MPEKPDQLPSLPSASEAELARLAARRRFTRAGLSAPVVLGTLVSKPVLGAPIYHCTVSGHVSGGSPHEGDNASCVVGQSRTQWLAATTWPSPLVKGGPPNASCNWPPGQGGKGTAFNGFGTALVTGGLAGTFYATSVTGPGASCTVSATVSTIAATMLQVLATDPVAQNTSLFQLGRATVVSLLNYYNTQANYPVTAHTIIAMFNATRLGGSYQVNSSVSWSQSQVLAYLTSLYPAV